MTLTAEVSTIETQVEEAQTHHWNVGDNVYTPIGITVLRPVVMVREIGSFGTCYAIDIGVYLNAYLPKWYTETQLLELNGGVA